MFLLDTCVVSELLKPRPDAHVTAWIRSQEEHKLHLSIVTPGEVAKGIAKHPDPARRDKLQYWLDAELLPRFTGRILDVTLPVSLIWGRLQGEAAANGTTLPVLDALMAATALAADLVIVTRNVGDFASTGVDIVNPWKPDLA